jgi:hypothetical protein
MSSVDTTRAPYDSDDQDGNNLFFCIFSYFNFLDLFSLSTTNS